MSPRLPSPHRSPHRLTAAALAVALAFTLGACGKKPKLVDPPQGKENDTFPHVYPKSEDGTATQQPKPAPSNAATPNLGPPNAGTSPGDPILPYPTPGGVRFP